MTTRPLLTRYDIEGSDYWTRRPGNKGKCNSPGDGVKKRTHKAERRQWKRIEEEPK